MHNCRWLKAQVLRKECYCNRLAKIMKEFGYKEIEISMEQCRCCSHCCNNLGVITH